MKPETPWQSAPTPSFETLRESLHCDVLVVGGGITGVTAAYLLKKAGKRVCLLERDRIGNVDTGLTTAHVSYVTDLRMSELVRNFGEEPAFLTWEAGRVAIDVIESHVRAEAIECEFRRVPGYFHAAWKGDVDETADLQEDAELARKLGFPARFRARVPGVGKPGILFPDQAKFHPLKYLAALAAAIPGEGSGVYEGAEVTEFKDGPRRAVVGTHEVEYDYLVIATHVPLQGLAGSLPALLFQSKIYPYSSYAIGASAPRGVLPEACFWDTSDPYYYLRVNRGDEGDFLIFGGEDHKTGQGDDTQQRFDRLAKLLGEIVPRARAEEQWSGQVIETHDGLPFIGEVAEKQFVATGFGGNGMTFGTVAGLMACDAVLGRENPWKNLFSPSRVSAVAGAWDYLTENVDYPYYYLKDRLSSPEGTSTRAVRRGEGKILDLEGERVACSRDEEGKVTTVSAYCTHMGCLVRWNGAEKTWDCPCHGSRFKASGEVMAGPAEAPLEPAGKKAKKTRREKAAK